jgi:hypothetical protein
MRYALLPIQDGDSGTTPPGEPVYTSAGQVLTAWLALGHDYIFSHLRGLREPVLFSYAAEALRIAGIPINGEDPDKALAMLFPEGPRRQNALEMLKRDLYAVTPYTAQRQEGSPDGGYSQNQTYVPPSLLVVTSEGKLAPSTIRSFEISANHLEKWSDPITSGSFSAHISQFQALMNRLTLPADAQERHGAAYLPLTFSGAARQVVNSVQGATSMSLSALTSLLRDKLLTPAAREANLAVLSTYTLHHVKTSVQDASFSDPPTVPQIINFVKTKIDSTWDTLPMTRVHAGEHGKAELMRELWCAESWTVSVFSDVQANFWTIDELSERLIAAWSAHSAQQRASTAAEPTLYSADQVRDMLVQLGVEQDSTFFGARGNRDGADRYARPNNAVSAQPKWQPRVNRDPDQHSNTRRGNAASPRFTPVPPPARGSPCFKCGSLDHWIAKCPRRNQVTLGDAYRAANQRNSTGYEAAHQLLYSFFDQAEREAGAADADVQESATLTVKSSATTSSPPTLVDCSTMRPKIHRTFAFSTSSWPLCPGKFQRTSRKPCLNRQAKPAPRRFGNSLNLERR